MSNYLRRESQNFNFGSGSTLQLTFMGWVKVSDTSGTSYLCSVRNSSSSDSAGMAVHINSGGLNGNVYMDI